MYLSYYRLLREPFHITPNPEFLFLSASHKEALGSIVYGIDKKKGFVAISGGVGVGKTTIVRSYLDSVHDGNLKIIYIFNANISFKGLVKTVFQELGRDVKNYDQMEMVNDLHLILIDEFKAGNSIVLIVDEAQNMPVETLENLRMLSNLETSREKLLQIVLVGQPEFDELLNRHELRQLKQRIAVRAKISPLTVKESKAYILHRLVRAGAADTSIFAGGALRLIVKEAKGIPRNLNVLCDNALITGYGYQKYPVTPRVVREVISDFRGKGRRRGLGWQFGVLGLLLLLSFGLWASGYWRPLLNEVAGQAEQNFRGLVSKVTRQSPVEVKHEVDAAPVVSTAPQADALPEVNAAPAVADREAEPVHKAVVRVVKEGDKLLALIHDVYGLPTDKPVSRNLIELVKKSNPAITDINSIKAGSKIVFPAKEQAMGKGQ